MRVKLSYTINAEDVLKETAKILSLSGEDLNHAITLFGDVQAELRGESDASGVVNTPKTLEMIRELREALLNVDTRLSEVGEIVTGYADYQRHQSMPVAPEEPSSAEEGSENAYAADMFGAD